MYIVLIADVANSKRHQRQDEILIIFTRTIQEISKVVCKKIMSETRTFIRSLCCMKRVHYSKPSQMAARGPNPARRPYLFGPLSTPVYTEIHIGQ